MRRGERGRWGWGGRSDVLRGGSVVVCWSWVEEMLVVVAVRKGLHQVDGTY